MPICRNSIFATILASCSHAYLPSYAFTHCRVAKVVVDLRSHSIIRTCALYSPQLVALLPRYATGCRAPPPRELILSAALRALARLPPLYPAHPRRNRRMRYLFVTPFPHDLHFAAPPRYIRFYHSSIGPRYGSSPVSTASALALRCMPPRWDGGTWHIPYTGQALYCHTGGRAFPGYLTCMPIQFSCPAWF